MGAELTGDWGKLFKSLDNLATRVKSETGKKIGQSIKKIEARVLDHMDEQDLDWDELDKGYAKRKDEQGLSPDILRATNQMYSNITTHQEDDFTGAVGVKRGVKNKDGEDVTDVAVIHEQPNNDGTKIPARKLWEPTFEEMKETIPPDIMAGVTELAKKK